jgi:hypothetical protein
MSADVGASWLVIGGTEADLLGRAERSSPEAAERRAAGAGLDGEERAPSYHRYCRDAQSSASDL